MNANITILGTANAGKTNFISEAVKDINTFSPKIAVVPKQASRTTGAEEWQDNRYVLKAYENIQWEFSICDYNGDLLKSHGGNCAELIGMFYEADLWIVLVDGTYFFKDGEADEKIIGKIKRYSARTLLPYISDYAEKHNGITPELLFVVTKANEIIGNFTSDRVKRIVMYSYEGLFTEDMSPMILLSETTSTKSAGLAILSLFYLRYAEEISDEMVRLESRNGQISNDIRKLQIMIYETEDRKILGKLPMNQKRVKNYEEQISSLRRESLSNDARIEQCRNNMGLKHLGTCVQCLIDRNPQIIINGFGRINYPYEKSMIKVRKDGSCAEAALKLDLCVLGVPLLYLIMKVGLGAALGKVIAICLLGILMYKIEKTVIRVILGGFMAIQIMGLCSLSGQNGWLVVFGYAALAALSAIAANALDKRRDERAELRFQDEVVYFFDTRAKEKK